MMWCSDGSISGRRVTSVSRVAVDAGQRENDANPRPSLSMTTPIRDQRRGANSYKRASSASTGASLPGHDTGVGIDYFRADFKWAGRTRS